MGWHLPTHGALLPAHRLIPHPPMVSFTSPANGDTGVAINGAVTAVFGETISASTLTIATFTVGNGSSTISGAVSYHGSIATFTPMANLASSATYTATITTGVKDLAGNAMVSPYTWSFTTGTVTDTTPPTIGSTSPVRGATGVAINSAITVTFSEMIDVSSITTASFMVSDNNGSIMGVITYDGTVAKFTPLNNLSYSTTYTATITTGVKDLAGNTLVSPYTWSFTTISTPEVPPPPRVILAVVATNPVRGATGVAVDIAVSATFSMYINGATLTNDTFKLSGGFNEVAGSVTTNGAHATFTPSVSLEYGTTYTATITTGVRAANWAGTPLDSDYSWSFTTISAPIPTPSFLPTPVMITTSSPSLSLTPSPATTPAFTLSPTATAAATPTPSPATTPAGSLSLSKKVAYLSGDTVVATVIDADRNTNSTSEDTLTTALKVRGFNYFSGADLFLDVKEDDINKGIFLATIKTGTITSWGSSSGTRTNIGFIKAIQGGIATVVYTDTNPFFSTISKILLFSSFNATLFFDADAYPVWNYAKITLADAERNTNHEEVESLLNDVSIETSPLNNTRVRMVETGVDTGTFVGTIQVVASGGTLEFDRIQATAGDALKITYLDEINITGYPRVVTDMASVAAVTQTPTAVVTPTATPTSAVCEAKQIAVFPGRLKIKHKKRGIVTVMLTGEGNCPAEGEIITVKVTKGRTIISVLPVRAVTDADGQAEFTVTARKRPGKAKVKFKANVLREIVTVKVVKQ